MKEFLKLDTDPYDVIRLFPDLLPQQNANIENTGPDPAANLPKLQDCDLESGILALIEFLTSVRRKAYIDSQTKASANASGNLNDGTTTKATSQLLQIIDTTLLKCYLQVSNFKGRVLIHTTKKYAKFDNFL